MTEHAATLSYDPGQFARDPAKAGSRQFMYDFLCKTFPGSRDKLKALYLSGPTPIEAEQVYLRAGLDPRNLSAIDVNPTALKAAEALAREKGLAIGHYCTTELDFLRNPPKDRNGPLEILSLDYLCTYGPMIIEMLDEVFDPEANHLADHAVLFINTQAQRENPRYQGRLALLNTFAPGMFQNDTRTMAYSIGSKSLHEKLDQHEKDAQALTICGLEAVQRILQGTSPKAGRRLSEARLGVFTEVYAHTQFPLFRRCSLADARAALTKFHEISDEQSDTPFNDVLTDLVAGLEALEDLDNFATRFTELVYHHNRTYRDVMKLAMASSVALPALYAGLGLEMYPAKTLDDALRAGFFLNRAHSWLITGYDVYTYTSASSTAMMLHAFNLRRRLTRTQRQRAQGYGLEYFLAQDQWHDQLCTSETQPFRTLRNALTDAGIDVEDFESVLGYPHLEHFRAGQQLEKMLSRKFSRHIRYEDLTTLLRDPQEADDVRQQYWERVVATVQRAVPEPPETGTTEKSKGKYVRKESIATDGKAKAPMIPALEEQLRGLHHQGYSIADLFDLFSEKVPGWTEKDLGEFIGGPTPADKDTMRLAYAAGLSTRDIYDLFHPRFPALSSKEISSVCAWARIYDDRRLQERIRMATIEGLEPEDIHEILEPAFPRLTLKRVYAISRWTKVLERRRE